MDIKYDILLLEFKKELECKSWDMEKIRRWIISQHLRKRLPPPRKRDLSRYKYILWAAVHENELPHEMQDCASDDSDDSCVSA